MMSLCGKVKLARLSFNTISTVFSAGVLNEINRPLSHALDRITFIAVALIGV